MEKPPRWYESAPSDHTAELTAIYQNLQHQVENPLGGDERSAAFAKGMLYLLDGKSHANQMDHYDTELYFDKDPTNLTALLDESILWRTMRMHELKRTFSPSAFTGLLMRTIQADRLEHPGKDDDGFMYPHDYTEPQAWVATLKNMLADLPRAEQFFLRIISYDLLSNVPQRAAALELGARALQEAGALPQKPIVYHVGCSQQEIEKKLAVAPLFPYTPVEILQGAEPSKTLTHNLNKKLTRRWLTRAQVGFDLNDKSDPRVQAFAKACSFYPSELLNEQRVNEYDALANRKVPNVHFIQGDFLAHGPQDVAKKLRWNQARPDIVFFSFSLYQQTADQQQTMLDHAKQHLGPKGWIFVLDFVRPDPSSPTGMHFEQDWNTDKYLCRLLVISGSDPHSTPHEMFVFENGRIERARLGMGLVAARNAGRKSRRT